MKKIIMLLIAILMLTFVLSYVPAFAEETITGVKLTELGIISWDEVEGAESYWLTVDIYSTPVGQYSDIRERITTPGDYSLQLTAYKDNSQTELASYSFYVRYDGKKFKFIEQSETTTSSPEKSSEITTTTESLPDVKITNVKLEKEGVLTWSTGDYTAVFMLGVDHHYLPAESGCSLTARITEAGEYYIEIQAYVPADMRLFDKYIFSVVFDGSDFSVSGGMKVTGPSYVSASDTAPSASASTKAAVSTKGTVSNVDQTSGNASLYWIIAIIAGLCVLGALLMLFLKKSKK